MHSVVIGAHEYSIKKLSAFEQLPIIKKVAPFLAQLSDAKNPGEALSKAFSSMSDDDAQSLVKSLLKACQRKIDGGLGWGNVLTSSGDLMFDDLSLAEMLKLSAEAAKHNFADFFLEITKALGEKSAE